MEVIDYRPAAENFRGNDKAGRYRFIFTGKLRQVQSLIAQMDEVAGLRITVMQKTDGKLRVIGHEQIKAFLVQQFFLAFQGLHDPGDEVIQVLEPEGAGNQVPEKEFGQPEDGTANILFIPEIAVLGQQIVLPDLRDDNGQVVLVDICIVCVDHILDSVREAPEDIKILRIGESLDTE